MGEYSAPALSQPGPHGYQMRFAVRPDRWHGLKICGADSKKPVRLLTTHNNLPLQPRVVLHDSGQERERGQPQPQGQEREVERGPALVSIYKPRRNPLTSNMSITIGSFTWRPTQPQNLMIILHNNPIPTPPGTGPAGRLRFPALAAGELRVELQHIRPYPTTYRFTLPTPAMPRGGETFEWRQARGQVHETRAIHRKSLPVIKTGDPRPPRKLIGRTTPGYVLVRVTGPRRGPGGKKDRPMGWTEDGEEIVASYGEARSTWAWRRHFYFQFWGAAATNSKDSELGEAFTHVAVATGAAIWQEEMIKEPKEGAARNGRV